MGIAEIVDVSVDQPRGHRPAAEVDHLVFRALDRDVVTDLHEPSVADPDPRDDAVEPVHRQDVAVDQHELIRVPVLSVGPRRAFDAACCEAIGHRRAAQLHSNLAAVGVVGVDDGIGPLLPLRSGLETDLESAGLLRGQHGARAGVPAGRQREPRAMAAGDVDRRDVDVLSCVVHYGDLPQHCLADFDLSEGALGRLGSQAELRSKLDVDKESSMIRTVPVRRLGATAGIGAGVRNQRIAQQRSIDQDPLDVGFSQGVVGVLPGIDEPRSSTGWRSCRG